MTRLFVTPQAEKDLADIFQYTFTNWGILQAERYQDDLFHGMEIILDNNKIGKQYPYSSIKYRKLHINRHLIFYRIENETCLIVRVLHDNMDLRYQLE